MESLFNIFRRSICSNKTTYSRKVRKMISRRKNKMLQITLPFFLKKKSDRHNAKIINLSICLEKNNGQIFFFISSNHSFSWFTTKVRVYSSSQNKCWQFSKVAIISNDFVLLVWEKKWRWWIITFIQTMNFLKTIDKDILVSCNSEWTQIWINKTEKRRLFSILDHVRYSPRSSH